MSMPLIPHGKPRESSSTMFVIFKLIRGFLIPQRDPGMYIATWGGPQNPPPRDSLLYSSEGAWTGLEYPIAGLALLYGLTDTGLHMLSDARVKYDGTRRR